MSSLDAGAPKASDAFTPLPLEEDLLTSDKVSTTGVNGRLAKEPNVPWAADTWRPQNGGPHRHPHLLHVPLDRAIVAVWRLA